MSLTDLWYSTDAVPPQTSVTLRVIMLTTPPMASEPYSDDIGPRITSIRSIIDKGGNPICFPLSCPFVLTERPAETGRPSTKYKVYEELIPRMLMSCVPAPPV